MDDKDLRRQAVRAKMGEVSISGLLAKAKSDEFVPFAVWDVTPSGLGILTPHKLKKGMELNFTVGQPYVLKLKGVVVWCHQEQDQDEYRAGISILDGQSKLEGLYYAVCQGDTKADDEAS